MNSHPSVKNKLEFSTLNGLVVFETLILLAIQIFAIKCLLNLLAETFEAFETIKRRYLWTSYDGDHIGKSLQGTIDDQLQLAAARYELPMFNIIGRTGSSFVAREWQCQMFDNHRDLSVAEGLLKVLQGVGPIISPSVAVNKSSSFAGDIRSCCLDPDESEKSRLPSEDSDSKDIQPGRRSIVEADHSHRSFEDPSPQTSVSRNESVFPLYKSAANRLAESLISLEPERLFQKPGDLHVSTALGISELARNSKDTFQHREPSDLNIKAQAGLDSTGNVHFSPSEKRQYGSLDDGNENSFLTASKKKKLRSKTRSHFRCWYFAKDPVKYKACKNCCSCKQDLYDYRRHHLDAHCKWGHVDDTDLWDAAKHASVPRSTEPTDRDRQMWIATFARLWQQDNVDDIPVPECETTTHPWFAARYIKPVLGGSFSPEISKSRDIGESCSKDVRDRRTFETLEEKAKSDIPEPNFRTRVQRTAHAEARFHQCSDTLAIKCVFDSTLPELRRLVQAQTRINDCIHLQKQIQNRHDEIMKPLRSTVVNLSDLPSTEQGQCLLENSLKISHAILRLVENFETSLLKTSSCPHYGDKAKTACKTSQTQAEENIRDLSMENPYNLRAFPRNPSPAEEEGDSVISWSQTSDPPRFTDDAATISTTVTTSMPRTPPEQVYQDLTEEQRWKSQPWNSTSSGNGIMPESTFHQSWYEPQPAEDYLRVPVAEDISIVQLNMQTIAHSCLNGSQLQDTDMNGLEHGHEFDRFFDHTMFESE